MWQLARHHMLKFNYGPLKSGTVVSVEKNWTKTFAIFPHRTIRGKYVWLRQIFVRKVWVYTGFIDELETQYGDLFDVLMDN